MGWFDSMFREPATSPLPRHAPDPAGNYHLALYKSDYCGYCHLVLRALDKLDVEVEMRDTMADVKHRRDLREATGRGTVPCLFIDGQPLFESRDIVAWLEAHARSR